MKARKRVIQGSTGAGKTYAIVPILIDKALKTPRLKITIVAETLPAVKEGAMDIFSNIMYDTGRWIQSNWNASSLTYKFGNGSRIQFKSFDSKGKAKASGKRDILFLNEANGISFEVADALMIRSKEIYLDFNPDAEFWAHTEILPEPNSEFLLLTFNDNEALPVETMEDLMIKKSKGFYDPDIENTQLLLHESNIKSKYWANWWRVYGLGLIGSIDGVVFENWEEINEIPKDAKLLYTGVDFGFSTSKFAALNVWYWNGHYVLDELVYKTGLLNDPAALEMKQAGYMSGKPAYCDYAEPKSIAELVKNGIQARKCEDKKDIKQFAIQKLNLKVFYVTKKSVNIVNELRYWVYDEHGKPKKSDKDHLMDALCYAVGSGDKYSGQYAVG